MQEGSIKVLIIAVNELSEQWALPSIEVVMNTVDNNEALVL